MTLLSASENDTRFLEGLVCLRHMLLMPLHLDITARMPSVVTAAKAPSLIYYFLVIHLVTSNFVSSAVRRQEHAAGVVRPLAPAPKKQGAFSTCDPNDVNGLHTPI